MIIAVSDVHMAEKKDDPQGLKDDRKFLEFLNYIGEDQLRDGGELVLLGDIIDLWRRDFVEAMMQSDIVIRKLIEMKNAKNIIRIHYLAGNHDYHILNLGSILSNFPFSVSKELRLFDGGNKFFFIHGYQLEVLANPYYKSMSAYEAFSEGLCLSGDDTGDAADRLWASYQASKMALEGLKRLPSDIKGALDSMINGPKKRLDNVHSEIDDIAMCSARSLYLGMEEDETLVFGHTHMPFDKKNGTVNTGSWRKSPCEDYTYLQIDKGAVKLEKF